MDKWSKIKFALLSGTILIAPVVATVVLTSCEIKLAAIYVSNADDIPSSYTFIVGQKFYTTAIITKNSTDDSDRTTRTTFTIPSETHRILAEYDLYFLDDGRVYGTPSKPTPVDKPILVSITCKYKKFSADVTYSIYIEEETLPPPPEEEAELDDSVYLNYLNSITFSIGYNTSQNGNSQFGTSWLISRIGNTGYEYYMATNTHVICFGNDNSPRIFSEPTAGYAYTPTTLFYSSTTSTSARLDPSGESYKACESAKVVKITDDVDLTILQVDFGTAQNILPDTKTKLDNFNAGDQDKGIPAGRIKDYKQLYTNTSDTTKKYIGGYPADPTHTYMHWEAHAITASTSNISSSANHYAWSSDTWKTHYYLDSSTQYVFNRTMQSDNWMAAGSSGSALINKDFEICGIYWGGFTSGSNAYFTPYVSTFKNSGVNFYGYL